MRPHRLKPGVAVFCLALLMSCSAPEQHPQESRHRAVALLHRAALRPVVVGRTAWHADERAVHSEPQYDDSVKAVFVHHTDHPNDYDCTADVPAMLRSIEEHHIHDMGWDDMGYNFVVDRCGGIYEGRAGGVDRAVRGAHTEGFNAHTVGIAALGSFGEGEKVPGAMLRAVASIAAWKLDPGIDPRGRVRLVSSNDESRYPKGTSADLQVISGHRDTFETDCPGDALYAALPLVRKAAAALREKATW
ncbi:N-acetylmuramoyl-L-alanine amidase [Streptomyces polygonati]|uniref:N-acetylmuramoyl-L-alanine amidase n=1 Tax=Streptomyces polygonati TaxID=1617087 RepID=A0ABV8HIL2_9ACTN